MKSGLNVKCIINGTKMIIEVLINVTTELGFNDEYLAREKERAISARRYNVSHINKNKVTY